MLKQKIKFDNMALLVIFKMQERVRGRELQEDWFAVTRPEVEIKLLMGKSQPTNQTFLSNKLSHCSSVNTKKSKTFLY